MIAETATNFTVIVSSPPRFGMLSPILTGRHRAPNRFEAINGAAKRLQLAQAAARIKHASRAMMRHCEVGVTWHQIPRPHCRRVCHERVGPALFLRQRRAPPRSVSHGRLGHRACPGVRGFVAGTLIEAATAELKPPTLGLG